MPQHRVHHYRAKDPVGIIGPIGSAMPLGVNFGMSGYCSFSSEGFPIFMDRIRESRGFTKNDFNTFVTVDSNGWPNGGYDTVGGSTGFTTILYDGGATQSWITRSGGVFKCGFTGTGSETVTASPDASFATVSNVVHSGTDTTFDLVSLNPFFGFRIGGVTGTISNIFAYLPGSGHSSVYSGTSLFTADAVTFYKQFATIRFMDWSSTLGNSSNNTSATRHTASNTKTQGNYAALNIEGYPVDWAVDLCNATGCGGWFNLPVNDDGTYFTAVANYLHTNMPTGKIYIELGNELWNGVGIGGSYWNGLAATYNTAHPGVLNYDSTTDPYILAFRYLALRLHDISVVFASVFGADFGTRVKLVAAWQTGGNGPYAFSFIMGFLKHQYGATNFIHALAVAPYKTRDNTGVPGDGANHTNSNDVVATVESQLTANGNYIAYLALSENIAVLGLHFGLDLYAYESGWETSGETTAAHVAAAIMDTGMTAVEQNYYSHCLDSGYSMMNWYESAVNLGGPIAPGYHFSTDYAALVSTGSPRSDAVISFSSPRTPARNLVNGSGSVIDGRNYVDNVSAMSGSYPTLTNGGSFAPYFGVPGYTEFGGYAAWLINSTVAGTFSLVGTFTTTASGSTNVEVNGTVVYTSVSIPNSLTNGNVTLGNVTLKKGVNYVLLGTGGNQPLITIKGLTFN